MANLIKNYLPLRINLPSLIDPSTSEETFAFIKPHVASSSLSLSTSRTLFVSNVPFFPNVKTSILLQTLFERFGDVEKVVVTDHPKKNFEENNINDGLDDSKDIAVSMFKKEIQSLVGGQQQNGMTLDEYTWYNEGRFAHVIFSTPKVMKKVWNMIQKNNEEGITFGKLELQELEDISYHQFEKEKDRYNKSRSSVANSEDNDEEIGEWDNNKDKNETEKSESQSKQRGRGITNLIEAKKASIPSRETLQMLCDQIMSKYEESEEEALRQKEAAKNQPDDDGFITVAYGANVGDVVDMERHGTLGSTGSAGGRKRKEEMRRGRSRTRSSRQNIVKGNTELPDFYRFQLKESKKRGMEDLKNRFQEDLKRVKKMKDEKMYRPF